MTMHELTPPAPAGNPDGVPIIIVDDLAFGYPGLDTTILHGIDLTVRPGELIILAGPSGSGKSTLCRHLNGVVPHFSRGEIQRGRVTVYGHDIALTPVHELATVVGMVQQSPESQIVCLKVDDELAFGPENLGLDHDEIVRRVGLATEWAGLEAVIEGFTFECSGGLKQRIAVGSALSLLPKVLIMDEPTTDLDPIASDSIVRQIKTIKDTLGMTFVIVEHEFDSLIEIADRLIVLHDGVIIADGPPHDVLQERFEELTRIGLRIPQHIAMSHRLSRSLPEQFSFTTSRPTLMDAITRWDIPAGTLAMPVEPQAAPATAPAIVELRNVCYSYDGIKSALKDVSLSIPVGTFAAVVGKNGSGKSTIARVLMGLLEPDNGTVRINGRDPARIDNVELATLAGYLFQDPDLQLFNNSVREEVAFGLRLQDQTPEQVNQRVQTTLELLRLDRYAERHPFSLSRGERQRLALATVLVTDPDIIVLDEPTTGQDRHSLDALLQLMQEWIARKHSTVIMIAHDMELVARYADTMVVVKDGRIVRHGPTVSVLGEDLTLLENEHLIPPAVVEASRLHVRSGGLRPMLTLAEFHAAVDHVTGTSLS